MNAADRGDPARDLAIGLSRALRSALVPGAGTIELHAAREVASILGLPALSGALAEFEPHAGGRWPSELEPLRDRLLGLAERCAEAGDAQAFRAATAALEALAEEAASLEWMRTSEEGPAQATIAVERALEDLALDTPAREKVGGLRLSTPVAAALRAALDWLAVPRGAARVRADDSTLEIALSPGDFSGVEGAAQLIEDLGGALLPPLGVERSWRLRVPLAGDRRTYLMVERDGVRIAIPWNAVSQIQMVRASELEARMARLVLPIVAPAPQDGAAEIPVVSLVHSLRVAAYPASRIIWRLRGEATAPDAALEAAGFARAVRTQDGAIYGVLDISAQLAGVPAMPIATLAPSARVEEREPASPPASEPLAPPPSHAWRTPHPVALDPRTVEPLELEKPVGHAPPGAPAPAPTMSVVPEPEAPRPEPEHFALDAAPAAPALELSNREARTPALLDAQDVEPLPALPPDPSPSAPAAAPRTASPPRPLVRQAPPPAASVSAPSASPAHEPVAPLPAPSAAEPPPSPVADRAATNRAILAEDSLTARIFLTRLLEQQGLEVRAVSRASELLSALEHEHWELVCVDVELPDARGEGMLREALRRAALRGASTLVALVRDETDAEMAARAGFRLALRKPFDQNAVRSLLLRARLIRSRES